jgi:hypothetical protein
VVLRALLPSLQLNSATVRPSALETAAEESSRASKVRARFVPLQQFKQRFTAGTYGGDARF